MSTNVRSRWASLRVVLPALLVAAASGGRAGRAAGPGPVPAAESPASAAPAPAAWIERVEQDLEEREYDLT